MNHAYLVAWSLFLGLVLPSSSWAVGNLKPIVTKQAEPLFGTRLKPVRVRIGVQFQRFESLLVKGEDEKAAYKSIPSQARGHTLRSRLEQTNHFYFSGLHVETVPLSWDKETMKYKVRLDFYKTYGLGGELEDKMGSVVATGELKGEGRIYNFVGHGEAIFKDTRGMKVAEVKITAPKEEKNSMISKAATDTINKSIK